MKNINTIWVHLERFYQLHTETRTAVAFLNNLEKQIFQKFDFINFQFTNLLLVWLEGNTTIFFAQFLNFLLFFL